MPQLLAIMDSLKGDANAAALQNKFNELKSQGLLGRERMFAGKNGDGEVGLFIRDSEGRIRLKIYCDRDNQPRLAIVDKDGKETSALK